MIIPASLINEDTAKRRLFSALSYFTFVPAAIFLSLRRFRHEPLVILFSLALVAAGLMLRLVFWLCAFIPRYGYLFGSLAVMLLGLGAVILWLVMVVKALQGEMFKMPIIGHFAEK